MCDSSWSQIKHLFFPDQMLESFVENFEHSPRAIFHCCQNGHVYLVACVTAVLSLSENDLVTTIIVS